MPRRSSRCRQTSSKASAKTGKAARSSAPIRARWAPWPVNRKAVRIERRPATTPGPSRPSASALERGQHPCPVADRHQRPMGEGERDTASEWPTSAGDRPGPGRRFGRERPAWARRAVSSAPESSHGRAAARPSPRVRHRREPGFSPGIRACRCPGASSRITCALVPPMPKAETPRPARAVRGGPRRGPRSAVPPGPRTSRRAGWAASACRVRGSSPCRMACTILMTPATPAAAWVWPRLDLTDPSHSGAGRGPSLSVGGQQGLRLDGVAEPGARAVRLHRVHVARRAARRPPAPAGSARCWAGPSGRGQPVGRAVGVDGGAAEHGQDRVAVAARVGQPLQQDESRALAPGRAVGRRRERLAAPVRRQSTLPAERR